MITLIPYQSSYDSQLNHYSIADEESDFALTPLKAIKDLADKEDAILIFSNHTLAGFFRLNFNDERYGLTQNSNSVLLKSFSVTETMQGQKIAQQALAELPHYIQAHYSDTINEIVLSVNFRNPKAKYIYEKCGFVDTGKVIGGRAGNQYVMSLTMT
ncbi:putative GNAT family acetyltransferase [Staphylococcus piscifermentans]|uniref:N-acetyltransferase n=1 Tax=Staphylococcus piscifermentans TaxID=70258 RepID=A0A239UHT7_9STAP|nr:GNAT family N-acetyltransferase [Staphylococcus piscifermentans]RTX81913.1 GNAT family N-acetyltransferase [Staphylococcus piscifermentans]GEP84966.1 N-acetyltransferase [Staphylococcus piscifermentans]SNV09229.1 putative GNAT family acetyltransferase [Staphylococcus piscifermentans]